MTKLSHNCVFEPEGKPCHPHDSPSFRGIICEYHLSLFGLCAGAMISEQAQCRAMVGPFLHVKSWVSFDPQHIIVPSRKAIDIFLGLEKNDKIELQKFGLSRSLSSFLDKIRTDSAAGDKVFQFEILRNLLVVDPMNDVNMAHGADKIKPTLKKQVQDRLNSLKTHVQHCQFYDYVKEHISIFGEGHEEEAVPFDKLSAFECFLLFNCAFDAMLESDQTEVSRLNSNVVYDSTLGYCVTTGITHPQWLVIAGKQQYSPLYTQIKVKIEDCKPQSFKPPNLQRMGDRMSNQNLLGCM